MKHRVPSNRRGVRAARLIALGTPILAACASAPEGIGGESSAIVPVVLPAAPTVAPWATLQGAGGNCLDVQYAVPESTVVDNATCNGTNAQMFHFNSNGTITNYWGYCLDVLGDNTTVGKLDFTTCNGTAAQQWHQHGTQIVGPAGKCLDVYGDNTASGTVVDLATCNGTQAQVWNVINVPTQLSSVGTKCLDIINSNTSPGARLQIFECNRGPNAQIYTFSAAGEIKNAVGECLDIIGGNDSAGQVQMTTCNGTGSQKWSWQGRALRSALNGAKSITGMCLGTVSSFNTGASIVHTSADHTAVGVVPCDGTEDQMWVPTNLFLPTPPATLLIVTSDALSSSFSAFQTHKTAVGINSKLLTVSQIRAAYPAVDDATSVKLAIADYFQSYGTEYVLLGGDASQVPVRYRRVLDGSGTTQSFLFSDLYYANLYTGHMVGNGFHGGFDTWDSNGNGLYDEQSWNAPTLNPDNVNGFPDVAVGRIPTNSASTMSSILSKIIATENLNSAYGGPGMPNAGKFGFAADACYGSAAYSDVQNIASAVGSSPFSGYAEEVNETTNCPAPSQKGFTTDTTSWSDFEAAVNASSYEFVTYVGHGGPGAWGYLGTYSSQASSLSNTYKPLAAAAACETAQFADIYRLQPFTFSPSDYDMSTTVSANNIGEMWLANPNGGASVYIGENVVLEDQPGVDFITSVYEKRSAGYGRIGDMWRVAEQAYFNANYNSVSNGYDTHFAVPWIYLGIVGLLGDPSMRLP